MVELDERPRSYIDDPRMLPLLQWMTFGAEGSDVSATWLGPYMPATRSDDADLIAMMRFNRDHYLIYLWFIANYMDRRGRVLDIGCGTGQRTLMLRRYAEDVIGVDTELDKIRFAASRNAMAGMGYVHDEFPGHVANLGTFDYIFAVEVLEHVELSDQETFVRVALRMLRPGGRLFISVPKDTLVERKAPHVGLWEPEQFAVFCEAMKGHLVHAGAYDLNEARRVESADLSHVRAADSGNHWFIVLESR